MDEQLLEESAASQLEVEVSAAQAGRRLDMLLVDLVQGLGRAGAKRLFEQQKVRVIAADGRRLSAGKGEIAQAGSRIIIEGAATQVDAQPDATVSLAVLLERADLVIVNKPAGQASAPLLPGELGATANGLLARYPEMAGIGYSKREPGLLHRLDTDTSGVLLAARTAQAFSILRDAQTREEMRKEYLLICTRGDLSDQGVISFPLASHPKDRRRVLACQHELDIARYAPRDAETHYEVLATQGPHALVRVRLAKASRHQVRAHLAALGSPLVGDSLYGGEVGRTLKRHALHAARIAWSGSRPGGASAASLAGFDVTAPLPEDFIAECASLGLPEL